MEDDNAILIEDDIVKAISFNGGISGIIDVLVDADNRFGDRSLKKTNFKIKMEHGKHMKHVGEKIWWK